MISNKLRTILSLLGIIIGVASVVAILTLGDTASSSIQQNLATGGLQVIYLAPEQGAKTTKFYDESICDELLNNVEGLDVVMGVYTTYSRIREAKVSTSAQISGVPSYYADMLNYTVQSGRWFSKEENLISAQVCVLGSDMAARLFKGEDPVGKKIEIFRNQAKSYTVVGVMNSKDPLLAVSFDSGVYIPSNTFIQRIQKPEAVSNYIIHVADSYDPITVSNALQAYLNLKLGPDSYMSIGAATLATIADSITSTFSSFLAAVAGISLVVGGIGIMNIMLVSVAERTREIGIRKALGATNQAIMGQFIVEAITLTLVGGAIGILFGVFISYAITLLANLPFSISYNSFLIAGGFSMVIGVFFGWYPAKKAAKLDPIESLNYE